MPNAGSRIEVKPAGVVKSPAFHAAYPRIINDDLIEPNCRRAMEESWSRGVFEERNIEVFHLQGAYVIGECLILDNDLQVVQNASDAYSDQEVAKAIADIKQAEEARTLPYVANPAIVTKQRAAHNYGHYLMYILPMGVLGAKFLEGIDYRLLVHRVPPPSMDVTFRSFRLLGVPLDRLLVQDTNEPIHFEHLIVVRGLSVHGTYMSPLAVNATSEMANKIFDVVSKMPGQSHNRLFIRRVPGWMRGREMHNEAEVARRLSDKGFLSVEPGSMSLDQQICLFKGAQHVVGTIGAAMTNIVFCRPGTKVTLLCPGSFPDTFFWFIATHRRLDYLEIRGDQTTHEGPDPWNAGFALRENDIEYLENVRTE